MINLQIEKLPEGVYLATSDNIQGLVVQGNSITETIEIARDVAKKLIEAQEQQIAQLAMFNNSFNYPLVYAEGTLRAILKQAGIQTNDFLNQA